MNLHSHPGHEVLQTQALCGDAGAADLCSAFLPLLSPKHGVAVSGVSKMLTLEAVPAALPAAQCVCRAKLHRSFWRLHAVQSSFWNQRQSCISCCRVFSHQYLLRSVKQEQQHLSQGTSLFSSPCMSLAATGQHRELKMGSCRRMRGWEPANYSSVQKPTCSLKADHTVCLRTGTSCCQWDSHWVFRSSAALCAALLSPAAILDERFFPDLTLLYCV